MGNLLTITETAKILGVCENTLRNWDETGKFPATKTAGGHRRYNLKQIRDYLEKNQTIESKEQIVESYSVDKWNEYLTNIPDCHKNIVATLLENQQLYLEAQDGFYDVGISIRNALWIVAEAWRRTRFTKMVNIQPMKHPCELIHYKNDTGLCSEPICCKTLKCNFVIHDNVYEDIENIYADALAAEIDAYIFSNMPNNLDVNTLTESSLDKYWAKYYDYLIIPDTLKHGDFGKLDLFKIPMILDSTTFVPKACGGRYPKPNDIQLPIFAPYILFIPGPKLLTGIRTCMMRLAWYNKDDKKES